MLILGISAAQAETWPTPQTAAFKPDWNAVRVAVPAIPLRSGVQDRLAELTAVASEFFPDIEHSPVPVLLPINIADYAHDRATDQIVTLESYAPEFEFTKFFLAGPTGYDAIFSLRPRDTEEFADINFRDPVIVQISAFNLLYDLPAASGAIIQKPGALDRDFPGLKRQILESTLRYSFERFGIPYVISIQCYEGPQRRTRLSCRNADRIASHFMRALHLVGGNPAAKADVLPPGVSRPEQESEVFTYHPIGSLLPGTAMRSGGGNADKTVYAKIRFPLAAAPAYVNSQSFMHGGDCNQTGRRGAPSGYRCRVNSKPLLRNEGAPENYAYPWRDNFCESRHFFVGQCPSGLGHQGQDIRPSSCETKDTNKARCQPYRHAVVAAREGMILREAWNDSFFLVTNAPGERVRFRHLHMDPRKLDHDGIISGHVVKEGEPIGTVGNYNRRPGWTTTHLHFEVQVPTRDGWVRVNPYMTLVASYEHLIRARGTEINEPEPEPSAEPSIEISNGEAAAASAAVPLPPRATNKIKSNNKSRPRAKRAGKTKANMPAFSGKARGNKRR